MRKSSRGSKKYRNIRVNGTDLPYRVARRDVKYPRLEFKTGELLVILPRSWKDEMQLLKRKINWISKKQEEIQRAVNEFKVPKENGRGLLIMGNFFEVRENGTVKIDFDENRVECNLKDRRQLKQLRGIMKKRLLREIEPAALEYCKKFGTNFNRIFVKRQKTKWASCSSKRNLSFNFWLISLPKELIQYVVCHEVLHLKEKRHNGNFWERLGREFENYREMERKLFEYWFFIQGYSLPIFARVS